MSVSAAQILLVIRAVAALIELIGDRKDVKEVITEVVPLLPKEVVGPVADVIEQATDEDRNDISRILNFVANIFRKY